MAQAVIKAARMDGLRVFENRNFSFGKPRTLEQITARIIRYREDEVYGNRQPPWLVWNTKLSNYAHGLFVDSDGRLLKWPNIEKYLEKKIAGANGRGEKLRVLDIGLGSGEQWLEFIKTHEVDFYGTALAMKHVHPDLRERVKLCTAASLYKRFAANSFDVVVTHLGAHCQEIEAIENALFVLKKGGEAVFVFEHFVPAEVNAAALERRCFELVKETENNGRYNVLHIRKL